MDPNCVSVSAKYLPLKPLTDAQREQMKTPCSYCLEAATPIFGVSGGGTNMPNLQVDGYVTTLKVLQWKDDRVYRIHITDKDQPDHKQFDSR